MHVVLNTDKNPLLWYLLNDKILEMENISVVRHVVVGQGRGGYDYRKATGRTVVVMKLFSILTTLCMWENYTELNTHSTHTTEYMQNWWNLNKTGGLYQWKYPGYNIVIISFPDVNTGANWTKGSQNLSMLQLYMNLQLTQLKFQLKKTEHVFIRVPIWNDISIKDIHVNMKDIRKSKLNIFKTS